MARRQQSQFVVADNIQDMDYPSDEESDPYGTSDDEDYDPDRDVDFDSSYDSDTSDDSVVIDQATRERLILRPETYLQSKDGKIQYSKEELPQNLRRIVVPSVFHKGFYKKKAYNMQRIVSRFGPFCLEICRISY